MSGDDDKKNEEMAQWYPEYRFPDLESEFNDAERRADTLPSWSMPALRDARRECDAKHDLSVRCQQIREEVGFRLQRNEEDESLFPRHGLHPQDPFIRLRGDGEYNATHSLAERVPNWSNRDVMDKTNICLSGGDASPSEDRISPARECAVILNEDYYRSHPPLLPPVIIPHRDLGPYSSTNHTNPEEDGHGLCAEANVPAAKATPIVKG